MAIELRAPHTHLYPGLRGRVGPGEPLRWSRKARDLPCVVEFSDGRTAAARIEGFAEDGLHLQVDAYVTGAGTPVPAKRWLLELAWMENAVTGFRVQRRLEAPDE